MSQLQFSLDYRERPGYDEPLWLTGQRSRKAQRDPDRYVAESFAHPGKMLPDLATMILSTYGLPGERWLDAMCGIGTTLVEGMELGLDMHGIEFEERWSRVCQANLDLGHLRRVPGTGTVRRGDARRMLSIYPDVRFHGIAFSPPYGNTLSSTSHGPDTHPERQVGGKRGAEAIRQGYTFRADLGTARVEQEPNLGDLRYGNMNDALHFVRTLLAGAAQQPDHSSYLVEMAKVYHQGFEALLPGGLMILVTRDFRREKQRIDLRGDTVRLCFELGFDAENEHRAMQCPVESDADGEIEIKSKGALAFWTVHNTLKHTNPPLMLPVFEDVLVFRKPLAA